MKQSLFLLLFFLPGMNTLCSGADESTAIVQWLANEPGINVMTAGKKLPLMRQYSGCFPLKGESLERVCAAIASRTAFEWEGISIGIGKEYSLAEVQKIINTAKKTGKDVLVYYGEQFRGISDFDYL